MHAIFDHITAILVGATLLGALLFIQMRQQQTAIDTVVRDRSQEHAGSFFEVAQREVENARTRDQAVYGLGYYIVEIDGTADRTDRFTFTTYVPPAPEATSPVGTMTAVSYRLRPHGGTVRVGTVERPVYRVERWVNTLSGPLAPATFTLSGVVATDVVSFVARAYDADGQPVIWAGTDGGYSRPGPTDPADDPVRFEIELETAARGTTRLASDQATTSEQNLARVAHSIRPVNVGANGSSTVTGPAATMRTIPLLPGEPPPAAPPPPGPSGPSSPQSPQTPQAPRAPEPPPPAPPPRPAPPAGHDI